MSLTPARPKRTRLRAPARALAQALPEAERAGLEARLGHRFADPDRLAIALTHVSAVPGREIKRANQRFEFLGDRVLGLVIAQTLLERFAEEREGGLASRLNALVNRTVCAEVSDRTGITAALRLGEAEDASGTRNVESVRADACEAVIGALYLDGGLKAARAFILKAWASHLSGVSTRARDAKTRLQHWALARGPNLPHYEVIARDGPDHAPRFVVRVALDEGGDAVGEGASKQAAEQAAATALLAILEDTPTP
jgi:ribonuclease-3